MPEEDLSGRTPKQQTKKSNGAGSRSSKDFTASSEEIEDDESPRRRKYFGHKRTKQGFQQIFVDVLGWGIFIVWVIGFGIDMLDLVPNWDLPAGIWGLMTIVSGGAFVAQAMSKETKE